MADFANSRRFFRPALSAALLAAPFPVLAAPFVIVPECARVAANDAVPQISCVMEMVGNVATLLLGVSGAFALLMFVYAGFNMVISAGDAGKVAAAKKILMNAVIGIFVIMTAGVFLRYGLSVLVQNREAFPLVGQSCSPPAGGIYVLQPDSSIKCESPKPAN